ncbi:lysosomal proton-coupled steroid conjugate and bile acid symporter SLC46A3-like [Phymastichus coffea]|uniref:lysosomal proton-coupled steroid conjugate and bile acid symporter SLC46A3-like n=1 Tax=Phymastichus coffea TaxID=108790 RepID=UPI00273CF037|nr:lysosomal proton-coupled steroid conjugate and bile acid symporter SLC46A3-like [Phymastichus coffea]
MTTATTPPRAGFRARCSRLFDNITVEPMVAFYIMPSVLASLATQNLNLEKACKVNLQYGESVCASLAARNTTHLALEETAVQQLVASMQTWKTALQSFFPSLLIVFMGAWSDRTGLRKPCMMLPIVGEFLTSLSLIACTYWFYELPMEAAGVFEALWPALTGGWFTMIMGTFSYMGDITSVESRTVRVGVVNSFLSLGVPVGMALSGVLYVKIGFYGVFGIAAGCYLFSFMYGLLVIREAPRAIELRKNAKLASELKGLGWWSELTDFFALRHVRETFRVAFKQGARNRRQRVMVLMLIVMVLIGPMYGEMSVMYLFSRYRFNWNEVQFSFFSTYGMVINLVGTLFAVGVFSHFFKMDDALLGALSCLSKILASIVYAFATTDWMIYLAPLVEIINGTSFIVMRSITSKLVPPDELGKVNSLFGVCEAIVPLVYGPMYSSIYAATVNNFPGTFFLVGGGLMIPGVVAFLWLYMEHRRDDALDREKQQQQQQQQQQIDATKPTSKAEPDNSKVENGLSLDKVSVKTIAVEAGIDNAAFESEKL